MPKSQWKTTRAISDLTQLIDEAAAIAESWREAADDGTRTEAYAWYRGDTQHFPLLPKMLRPHEKFPIGYEPTFLADFVCQASAHIEESVYWTNDWDWFFAAQHHGVATRLLDWSESLSVSAWFALRPHFDARLRPQTTVGKDFEPCVWMLNPSKVNLASVGEDRIFVANDPFQGDASFPVENWTPRMVKGSCPLNFRYESRTCTNEFPIAIYPRRRNRRIHSQRGAFTLHGFVTAPLVPPSHFVARDPVM